MKQSVMLDAKDIKTIIARYLGVSEENVIQSRYSFSVIGVTSEEINQKLEGK